MDGSRTPDSGFSPLVLDQLNHAVMKVSGTRSVSNQAQIGPSWNSPRPNHQPQPQPQLEHANGFYTNTSSHQPPNPQSWSQQVVANPSNQHEFPPLGTERVQQAIRNPSHQQQQHPHPHQMPGPPQYQMFGRHQQTPAYNAVPPPYSSQPSHSPQRAFNTRGRGRPYRNRGNPAFTHPQQHFHQSHPVQLQNADDFNRPPPVTRKLFAPGAHPQFNSVEDQRAFQRMIMDQSDFLNHLANQSLKDQLTTEEQQAKECFRKELEAIVKKVIQEAKTDDMQFDTDHVQLVLYGSLGSGFAVAGSDMDLLLAFPQNEGSLGSIEIESRRLLEKALLDAGIGARLLTNTRVPILRVCQKPSQELLQNLRDYRSKWEESLDKDDTPPVDEGFGVLPVLTNSQATAAAKALEDLDFNAHEIPLPASPAPETARLEYVGDCGIQCDINFSNYVALHNTRLLRTYGLCDPRVRQVGVFVKKWAKSRDINTPYHGTLSSYGYILMVLHYLMNIVSPPVIPNLQDLAKHKDTWEAQSNIELVEGHDVRFVRDAHRVQAILKEMPRNHESVGALLRGFFWYYADPRGFHWKEDVVSIRTRGGRLRKHSKGWTEAKWSGENQHVRLRYLLAIEDPFEVDHNVARTVGHYGIVSIRDEFRRAWGIIENAQYDDDAKLWFWLTKEGRRIAGHEMIATSEKKGDLLRKDQEYARQRARQMRLDLEAKEKALRTSATQDDQSFEEAPNGMSKEKSYSPIRHDSEHLVNQSFPSLINDHASQIGKEHQTSWEENTLQETEPKHRSAESYVQNQEIDWDKPFDETEVILNAEFVNHTAPQAAKEQDIQPTQNTQIESLPVPDENVSGGSEVTKSSSRDPLPVKIAWERQSKDGRWLCWRDNQIITGKWTGANSRSQRRLDEEFPYNPNMTMTELAEKNEILISRHAARRKNNRTAQAQPDIAKSIVKTDLGAPVEQQPLRPSVTKMQNVSSLSQIRSSDVRTDVLNVVDRASRSKSSATAKRDGKVLEGTNSTARREETVGNQQQEATSKPYTGRTSTEKSESSMLESVSATIIRPSEPAVDEHEQPLQQTDSIGQQIHKHLVLRKSPTSPLPSQDHSTEDKDVNITQSIPGFQFDPRQLADLETIRLGGNGCARSDQQLDVEEDNKFNDDSTTRYQTEQTW